MVSHYYTILALLINCVDVNLKWQIFFFLRLETGVLYELSILEFYTILASLSFVIMGLIFKVNHLVLNNAR